MCDKLIDVYILTRKRTHESVEF
uniref:Uncharacterized protein n=1 Tax=Anguilla anguilla TaxID=7936 RepID=A0A0E9V2V1_ANGAN